MTTKMKYVSGGICLGILAGSALMIKSSAVKAPQTPSTERLAAASPLRATVSPRVAPPVIAAQPVTVHPVKTTPLATENHFVYTFEGTALCEHGPCRNANILVKVLTGNWLETRDDVTDASGHYFVQVPVVAFPNQRVEWAVEAHSTDFRGVELAGQRIATNEDTEGDVRMENTLTLAAI
jgi:hypothetical protein